MSAVFDALAADYDRSFTASVVGGLQRRAVMVRVAGRFAAGDRVLEVGCGTGEDAVSLARRGVAVVATDPSPAMLEVARRKADAAGVGDRVQFHCLAAEDLERSGEAALVGARFDGAFSSFGALNLSPDLAAVSAQLARRVRPGGTAMLCLLGRWVPWEWLWYGLRGAPRTALRRLRPGGAPWRGTTVRYPPLRQIRRDFGEHWRMLRVAGVGILVPPSYAESWAARHPRLVERLARLERMIDTLPPLDRLGDHVLIELQRR